MPSGHVLWSTGSLIRQCEAAQGIRLTAPRHFFRLLLLQNRSARAGILLGGGESRDEFSFQSNEMKIRGNKMKEASITLSEGPEVLEVRRKIPMNEQFVVIEGLVGGDKHGISVHHSSARGHNCYLAYIGLRDGSRLIWQEIEMSQEQANRFNKSLVGGNLVRVSGLLKKQLSLPVCRVQVESVELLRAEVPMALRTAA